MVAAYSFHVVLYLQPAVQGLLASGVVPAIEPVARRRGIVVEYFGFVGFTLFMMQQVQQQEAVIAGSFHDVVMLSDSKRTDELTHSRSGVRKSLNTATVR